MIPPKKLAMLPMLLLLLLLYMACAFGCVDKSTSSARPEEVRFITVTEERLVLTSSLPGRVAPIVVSEVRPQVDGIILERLFEWFFSEKKPVHLFRIFELTKDRLMDHQGLIFLLYIQNAY